ncbi:acyl-CoA dehydrogenase family protein [Cryptosporangium aurantiacum]|uniref:Medium-chain specific acyl-CoA dehydrogenase, mitochondrial n=1 Tax=Cryptosporangium aurantiacum TaxID=134849 RepID=A0A1M7MAB4_9ACTN|nr:acyl-CoA dehydrogenase family protein [Cryptosporangium aurantiacum]SHM87651.1 Acyl-CoA dehydrogenase [Cryptosporangium aurantiacum]
MYGLSPTDLEIRARARAFADELIPYEVEAELAGGQLEPKVAESHHRRALELGLYATNMPTDLGGGGYTLLQQVLVQEQVGRVTNGLGWVMHTPAAWFAEVATPYQRERWLLPTVRGEMQECYAITEEGAGSDVDAITATARRDGDAYLIDGVKWHVTSYDHAAYAFVQAKLESREHALFVVDLPSPGVRVVRTPEYTHTLTHRHPIVAFEGVRVPVSHLVGAEGDGMAFSYAWFRFERLMVAARCLGAAERLIDEADAFAATRIVGGEPLRDRQLVAAMLADSVTELFAARAMVYETAREIDTDLKLAHARCSMVKLFASEMANRVADRAVQIFGGRGYMRENVAERLFRELRVERIWEGASEVQRLIVADQLAKRGVTGLV